MHYQHAQELFSDYVEGKLDPALTLSLENFLASNPEAAAEVEALRRVMGVLNTIPDIEPPRYFHANIMARLEMEQEKEAEAALRSRSVWDWRSLFRTRALATGAACLVLLLMGVEVVQTQRSELGPFSWVINAFRPTPRPVLALQKATAEWLPYKENGGELVLHLRAQFSANGGVNTLAYRLTLNGYKGVIPAGEVSSMRETEVRLKLDTAPDPAALSIEISPLSEGTDTRSVTKAIPITIPTPAAP